MNAQILAEAMAMEQILPLLIPIVAILGGVLVVIIVILIDHRKKSQWLDMHHKERLAAIERGVEGPPLPPEFFSLGGGRAAGTPQDLRTRSLRHGLLFLLIGLALSAALAINRDLDSAAWGLIPMAIGVANLLFARMTRPGA